MSGVKLELQYPTSANTMKPNVVMARASTRPMLAPMIGPRMTASTPPKAMDFPAHSEV